MLRMYCAGDSSNWKHSARSPRRQAASRKCAARLVLAVPAPPEISTLLARKIAVAAEHLVEPRRGRSRSARDVAVWTSCSEVIGSTAMPRSIDQERILVGAVARAAVLHDAQPARRDLIVDAMVEHDHAVGDVLFEPLAGQRVDAALAGDHRGDAAVLQPGEQPPQLGAQHPGVAQSGEQRLDRVEDDPLGADRTRGRDPAG